MTSVAGAQLVQNLLEGAVGSGVAGGLGEHPVAAGALERADLQVRLLVGGGDAGVAEEWPMPVTVAKPCDKVGCAALIADTSCGRVFRA